MAMALGVNHRIRQTDRFLFRRTKRMAGFPFLSANFLERENRQTTGFESVQDFFK